MRSLTLASPAKINLYLNVGPRRKDGYHEIDTVMSSVRWGDRLEIGGDPKEAPTAEQGYEVFNPDKLLTLGLSFEAGYPGSCRDELLKGIQANLVFRAYALLRKERPAAFKKPLWMALHKAIPTGAGLGGGSSNAAAALKGLNAFLGLKIPGARLMKLGAELGSDVPFFLKISPSNFVFRAAGRGEKISKIFWRKKAAVLVMYPGFAVGTRWAYEALDLLPGISLTTKFFLPTLNEKAVLELSRNRFESVVFQKHPVLAEAKATLKMLGADLAGLSGSGSCLFALGPSTAVCRQWAVRMKAESAFSGFYFYVTQLGNGRVEEEY